MYDMHNKKKEKKIQGTIKKWSNIQTKW